MLLRVVPIGFALAALLIAGCGQEVRTMDRGDYTLHHIVLDIANVWMIDDQRGGTIMIDAGAKDDGDDILAGLEVAGIGGNTIELVGITHGHLDHAGAAKFLQDELSVPIALHGKDLHFAEAGKSVPPEPQTAMGAVLKPLLDPTFPAFEPDVFFGDDQRLDAWGIAGSVVHLPGHTDGTVAFVMDNGDAYVGDIVAGTSEGSRGDHEGRCDTHLFSEDFEADRGSMEALLARGVTTFFPGHGPFFDADTVRGWLEDTQTASDAREHNSKDLAVQ